MNLSDAELLLLGAYGGRAPTRAQRVRQADLLAEFSATEPLPSSVLVGRRRWARREATRRRMIARRLGAVA